MNMISDLLRMNMTFLWPKTPFSKATIMVTQHSKTFIKMGENGRDQFLLKRNDFFWKSFMQIADFETWIVQYICSTLCFCKSLLTSHNCKLTTTNRPWWQWWCFALFNMRCYNFCKITLMQKFALPNLGHVSKKKKEQNGFLMTFVSPCKNHETSQKQIH